VKDLPPIVFLVFDELSLTSLLNKKGVIDAVKFPNFYQLQKKFDFYSNAHTTNGMTHHAMPALLTGNYPRENKVASYVQYPKNLFFFFKDFYKMNVWEHSTHLCPSSINTAGTLFDKNQLWATLKDSMVLYGALETPLAYTSWLPEVTHQWESFIHDKPEFERQKLDAFLNSLQNDSSWLHYFHSRFPHVPYNFLPSGKSYGSDSGNYMFYPHKENRWNAIHTYQRYYLQVMYADKLLGQIIFELKKKNLFDKAIIIVTSDHGVSFHDVSVSRGIVGHRGFETTNVPLFLKNPNQNEGQEIKIPVSLVDIVPTLLKKTKINTGLKFDGYPLSLIDENRELFAFSNTDGFPKIKLNNFQKSKYLALKKKFDLFPLWNEHNGLFKVGKYVETTDKDPPAHSSHHSYTVNEISLFKGVDLEKQHLPLHITGKILSSLYNVNLAISVNDKFVSFTKSYERDFLGLLPEDSLVPGKNSIDIYYFNDLKERFEKMLNESSKIELTEASIKLEGKTFSFLNKIPDHPFTIIRNSDGYLEIKGWIHPFKFNSFLPQAIVVYKNQVIARTLFMKKYWKRFDFEVLVNGLPQIDPIKDKKYFKIIVVSEYFTYLWPGSS